MPENEKNVKMAPIQVKVIKKLCCSECGSSWLYRRVNGEILCRKCGNVNKPVVEGSK